MHKEAFEQRAALAAKLGRLGLIILLSHLCSLSARAQSFSSAAGLLQGERIARATPVYNDTLFAEADTTAWLPFGTHIAALAPERVFAPTRFTLFAKLDTAGIAHAADPELTVFAQLALSDTTQPYEQEDGSLALAPTTDPLIRTDVGLVLPVPVYGGGWIRFIVESSDTLQVRLDLWRVR